MEKVYFIASSSLKIKCGKSKGMQEKVTIMGVGVDRKSLMMPISDPRDRFFYPHYIPMKDTYSLGAAQVYSADPYKQLN